jgi:hypothetical protein
MAQLTIKIDLDNAAFEDHHADEVTKQLAAVQLWMLQGYSGTREDGLLKLVDSNGNTCGVARLVA